MHCSVTLGEMTWSQYYFYINLRNSYKPAELSTPAGLTCTVSYRWFDFEKGNRDNSLNKYLIKAARRSIFSSETQGFKSNIFQESKKDNPWVKKRDNLSYYYWGDPTCCRNKNPKQQSPDRGEVLPKSGIYPRKQLKPNEKTTQSPQKYKGRQK